MARAHVRSMRHRRVVPVLALAALMFAGAAPAVSASESGFARAAAGGSVPAPPEEDPFYEPPSGFASTEPGTVLRRRPVTIAAAATIPLNVRAWQLLYRTSDHRGEPTATVTTVLVPADGTAAHRPLVSYLSAQDSSPMKCAPSYQLRRSLNWDNTPVQIELVFLAAMVRKGWVVTVPDHLGPEGMLMAGPMSAHASLDAVRATENFQPAELSVDTPVAFWGYSGGAHAAGWTANAHHEYAPELNVRGTAVGGMMPNIAKGLPASNRGLGAGAIMAGLSGLMNAYPDLRDYIDRVATPEGRRQFAAAGAQCFPDTFSDFAFADVDSFSTVTPLLGQPLPRQLLRKNNVDAETRTSPMFVYHAVADEVVPSRYVDEWVDAKCSAGGQVTYQRELVSEHIITAATVAPAALDWLRSRLSGTPAPTRCIRNDKVSSLLDPRAVAVLGKTLVDTLIDLLGRPVGTRAAPDSLR